jgi:ATP-dependent exoDNAse (exonuclease V) beta subunit
VEKAWLELGGSAELTQNQSDNVEFFFEVLDECWLLKSYMDISWIEDRIKGLYADYGNPDAKIQLMTIHKAKGLEFDCVFLPGLNRQARASEKPVLLMENFLSLTKKGGIVLAGFDKEKERRSIYNYLWYRKKLRSLEEDKRLLYVATTRAKVKLYLSGSVKDFSEEDCVASSPVPRKNSFLSLIWSSSKSNIQTHKQVVKSNLLDDETLKIKRTIGFSSIINHPKGNSDPVLEWPQSASSSLEREVGIVVHQTLEAIVGSGLIPSVNDLKTIYIDRWIIWLNALAIPQEAVSKALTLVESNITNLLNDTQWGEWILGDAHQDSHAELSLTYMDSQSRIQDLVIDRTFIEKETGVRWIIDYKTTQKRETETLKNFVVRESRKYSQQLKSYRNAMTGSEKRTINCGLYFTSIGHFEHLQFAEE